MTRFRTTRGDMWRTSVLTPIQPRHAAELNIEHQTVWTCRPVGTKESLGRGGGSHRLSGRPNQALETPRYPLIVIHNGHYALALAQMLFLKRSEIKLPTAHWSRPPSPLLELEPL